MPRHDWDPVHVRCTYCGDENWSLALGTGLLKLSGVIVGQYDTLGEPSMAPGIELAAFSCNSCGYIRWHDPAFIPPDIFSDA